MRYCIAKPTKNAVAMTKNPKCKNCGERFKPKFFTQPYCTDKEDCSSLLAAFIAKKYEQKKEKEWKKQKAELRPKTHSKEYKADLQREVNKLARMIDLKFFDDCIDCIRKLDKQVHGAHFLDVGGNNSIRYNLHNIHASRSECNKFSSKHKQGYEKKLVSRYGEDYLEYLQTLPRSYPLIKLTEIEVVEKLKIVRSLIRNFDTFNLESPIKSRDMFNRLIGIYEQPQ